MKNTEITTIIPATPGWRTLWLDPDTGELTDGSPILAWALVAEPRRDGAIGHAPLVEVHAIGTDGTSDNDVFLLHPDGAVEAQMVEQWPSLAAANAPEACASRMRLHTRRPGPKKAAP